MAPSFNIQKTSWQTEEEEVEAVTDLNLLGFKITTSSDCSHNIKRCLLLGKKAMTNLGSILKSRDIILPTKVHIVKAMFSSSHVWLWQLDYKESWEPKNWWFWTVVLEKTLESLLDCKEIKSVNPKGNQLWKFIGRTDAEAELQYFGHLMWRTNALEKTLMLGMTEGKRRREWQRMRWLDSITNSIDMNLSKLRESKEQGSLACSNPWGHEESDMTWQLNNN